MAIDNRDSGRLGKAVEHLVAATCILTSGMELNVSSSFVDDEGVDLVFARRGQPKTLAVQVKSRRLAGTSMSQGTFRTQVRDATFSARDDLYLLFVAVDPDEGVFDLAWFVPSINFAEATTVNSQGRRRFVASAKENTRDQWSGYRCSRQSLAERILASITACRKGSASRVCGSVVLVARSASDSRVTALRSAVRDVRVVRPS